MRPILYNIAALLLLLSPTIGLAQNVAEFNAKRISLQSFENFQKPEPAEAEGPIILRFRQIGAENLEGIPHLRIENDLVLIRSEDLSSIDSKVILGISNMSPSLKLNKSLKEYDGHSYSVVGFTEGMEAMSNYGNYEELYSNSTISIGRLRSKKDVQIIAREKALIHLDVDVFQGMLLNEESRAHASAMRDGGTSLSAGLDGDGLVLGIGDGGTINHHIDLKNRSTNFNSGSDQSWHAVHVAGTMASNGLVNPRHRGFSPKLSLISDQFSNIIVQAPDYFQDYGMRFTNNSYGTTNFNQEGCAAYGSYDAFSNLLDDQLFTYDEFVHVFAAGNDGAHGGTCPDFPGDYGTVLKGPQSAKSTLVVGAANKNAQNTLRNSSSKGPTKDGRIKPEVVAIGSSVTSLDDSGNSYANRSGTSMASPAVTAVVGMIDEKYREMTGGNSPTGEVVRALICNGAEDRGNEGPDFEFGFGVVNAYNSLRMVENMQIISGSVSGTGTNSHNITVPAGTERVKVLLHWSDEAAAAGSTDPLINDLDLSVINGGNTTLPLILDPNNPSALAQEGTDALNVYEQVVLDNPVSGSLQIDVTKSSNGSPQDYTITYTFDNGSLVLHSPAEGYSMRNTGLYHITWSGLPSATNFHLEYSTDNGGSWVNMGTVPGADHSHAWSVPALYSAQMLLRITDLSDPSRTAQSEGPFVIAPDIGFSATSPCMGYVRYTFSTNTNFDGYVLLYEENGEWVHGDTVQASPALLGGLPTGQEKYVSVAPILSGSGGMMGMPDEATPVTISSSMCNFAQDLIIHDLVEPANGRQYTGSALGTSEDIRIIIDNIGTDPISNFDVEFDIDGNTVVETVAGPVLPGSALVYTTSNTWNLSAFANYQVTITIDENADPGNTGNNTFSAKIKHVENPALNLSNDYQNSYVEGFESLSNTAFSDSEFALDGADRYDYYGNTPDSRMRTFISGSINIAGNRTISLDSENSGMGSDNEIRATYNLSNHISDPVRMDISYMLHQGNHPFNAKVRIKGSESDPWLTVVDFSNPQYALGEQEDLLNIDIAALLSDNSQSPSATTMVSITQTGNDRIIDRENNKGLSFDQIRLYTLTHDLAIAGIDIGEASCTESGLIDAVLEIENTAENSILLGEVLIKINLLPELPLTVLPTVPANSTIYVPVSIDLLGLGLTDIYDLLNIRFRVTDGLFLDQYDRNDTLTIENFKVLPLISDFPYKEDFEGTEHGFLFEGDPISWERAIPAGAVIDHTVDGEFALITNADGDYLANETSTVYSPCFDFTGMSEPALSYLAFSDLEAGYDSVHIEYSEDGDLWFPIPNSAEVSGISNSAHSGSTQRWVETSIAIPMSEFSDPSQVKFRWRLESDQGLEKEGLAIDNLMVYEKSDIQSGSDVAVTVPVSGTGEWEDILTGSGEVIASIQSSDNLGDTEFEIYHNSNPDLRHNNEQYYLDRNFVINSQNAPSNPASVRFYFSSEEFVALMNGAPPYHAPANLGEIGVTQYDGINENGILEDNDGSYHFHDYADVSILPWFGGYAIEIEVDDFSEFYINSGLGQGIPLPIDWLSINRSYTTEHHDLSWRIFTDEDLSGFSILRSEKGIEFEEIDFMETKHRLFGEYEFAYEDKSSSLQKSYFYKVAAITTDADENISPVVFAPSKTAEETITVFPNPVDKELHISSVEEIEAVRLESISGRPVFREKANVHNLQIPMQNLADGFYVLTVKVAGKSLKYKILKK